MPCISSSDLAILKLTDLVHLERLGSLNEETVRFYIAELSSALAFLHERRIIHRCVTAVKVDSPRG